jgi:hypothetical protein
LKLLTVIPQGTFLGMRFDIDSAFGVVCTIC